ncbi:MAG: hypothetical protein OHK0024_32550 [Thalassobaculales bacterium]
MLLALGANLGDRLAALRAALAGIRQWVAVGAVSTVYETDPRYVTDQPKFLNACLAGETALPPAALLARLKALETAIGRRPGQRHGPREIDIDILAMGALRLDTPDLVLPHPRLAERAFVLRPLAEVAPGWRHPANGLTPADMLAALTDDGGLVARPDLPLD